MNMNYRNWLGVSSLVVFLALPLAANADLPGSIRPSHFTLQVERSVDCRKCEAHLRGGVFRELT